MFFKILNKVRKKPEASKELIALGVSLSICAVIAIAWVIYFVPHANDVLSKTSPADIAKPFDQLADFAVNNTPDAPSFVSGTSSELFATSTATTTAEIQATSTSTSTKNLLK